MIARIVPAQFLPFRPACQPWNGFCEGRPPPERPIWARFLPPWPPAQSRYRHRICAATLHGSRIVTSVVLALAAGRFPAVSAGGVGRFPAVFARGVGRFPAVSRA